MRKLVLVCALVIIAHTASLTAGISGTEVVVPSVGKGPGAAGSQWKTTLWIHNPGSTMASVEVAFLQRGSENPSPAVTTLSIRPGATARLGDAMDELFGLAKAYGAFLIRSNVEIVVNARIFSQKGADESASVGQFFTAIPTEAAIGAGESASVLGVFQLDPQSSSPFRYNFGFVEVAGASVKVEAVLRDGAGTQVASKIYTLGPLGADQRSVSDLLSTVNGKNFRLVLRVANGSGRIVAFGSGIANTSNDPSTFEMTMDRSKLTTSSTGGGIYRVQPGRVVDITTKYPTYTEIITVRVPAGDHLVVARFNLQTNAVSHGTLGGATKDDAICRIDGPGRAEDTAVFGTDSHGQIFDERYDMPGTLVMTMSSTDAEEVTLECSLFDTDIITYGGWVRATLWGIYALEVTSIGTLAEVE